MHEIKVKRIYLPEEADDGYRILADRLWPRGMSKARADLDLWDKEDAPTKELRDAFHHQQQTYDQFSQNYKEQLDHDANMQNLLETVRQQLQSQNVTLLYASKDEEHNNALILKDWLEQHLNH